TCALPISSDAIRILRGFVERLLLFLGCLLCLLCLLRFLGHVALRDPKSWLDASRQSACIDSEYTIVAKLILRASKRVNDHRTVATCNRTKPSPDARTPRALTDQDRNGLISMGYDTLFNQS